ncbi:hypothetical protein AVEN_106938-1 [Araneus ventricosus]|uniref:Uncharacterized protein n=1 Tax=Araneus ventricosus TaxID=182803 RepID=A0A4Y2TX75_ARAVE|nr:hypothetical protein AVEN_81094-1 [Araneus ventricosus]GBO05223.1 hypothetical protein AVEN_106938-1 [Araneus ventricosus]
MELLLKLFAEFETDDDPDLTMRTMDLRMFQKRFFSDHESFCHHDTESEEEEDSRNDDVNSLELFSSKEGTEWRKKLGKILVVIILCRSYLEKSTTERCEKPCEELGVIHQR